MKPPTVFLGEMTNPEVEAFLKTGRTDHSYRAVPSSTARMRPSPRTS